MEIDQLGIAPDGPHLALQHQPGLFIAIPPGAMMAQIMDPEKKGGITRLLLVKVENGHWTFRCVCNPQCKAVFHFVAKVDGNHQ